MVSNEMVEAFMLKYFPKCPLCSADKGYEVSGFSKNYVQCRSCGAKWESTDFVRCKELKELQLWEPSHEGKGTSLKFKKYSVKFWQDSEAIENAMKAEEAKKGVEKEVKATVETSKFIFQLGMSDHELEDLIEKSLEEITHWDYGSTLYGKLGSLISDTSFADATIIRLLKAILEQNKILIIQNELLRRVLSNTKTTMEKQP